MDIVGLPDAAVQESKQRVQAAIKNTGFDYPRKRIVVNLAPATVRKEGPAYDLPIALGVLMMSHLLPPGSSEGTLVVGEFSLDGAMRAACCPWPLSPANRASSASSSPRRMPPRRPWCPGWK
jgi:magnesium chelatase family protein